MSTGTACDPDASVRCRSNVRFELRAAGPTSNGDRDEQVPELEPLLDPAEIVVHSTMRGRRRVLSSGVRALHAQADLFSAGRSSVPGQGPRFQGTLNSVAGPHRSLEISSHRQMRVLEQCPFRPSSLGALLGPPLDATIPSHHAATASHRLSLQAVMPTAALS